MVGVGAHWLVQYLLKYDSRHPVKPQMHNARSWTSGLELKWDPVVPGGHGLLI